MEKNIKNFVELVAQNQDAKVMPMIYTDVVLDDDYAWQEGRIGKSWLDDICDFGDRIYLKSVDEEELKEDYIDCNWFEWQDLVEEEISEEEMEERGDKFLNNVEWTKVIVVEIGLS